MADLFISYRRGDSAYALLLYDRLSASFGRRRVFRDVETIKPGRYFDEAIRSELKRARAVVAVIGPEWLRALARLKDRNDWVRKEIVLALKYRRRLFPVLVGGVEMPKAAKVPRVTVDLTRANAVTLTDATFHRDVDALVEALSRVLPLQRDGGPEPTQDPRQLRANQLLRDQVARLQIRAVELIQENKVDRALDELTAGHELLMLLMDWSPAELHLDLQLGYLYKTLGQAFAASDRSHAERYIDLAASIFERVKNRPPNAPIDTNELAGAVNGLGNVYAERGQLDRALDMYRVATELVPQYSYAWHDMFGALNEKARAGDVDVSAMRLALDNVKRTGTGQPGLSATYLAQLEGILERWARAEPERPVTARPGKTRNRAPAAGR
jgi:tetratricopeptide (TPR) repeat protein